MSRTLLQEIAHQIFYTPKKKRYPNKNPKKPRDRSYERIEHNLKKAEFENRKTVEIARHIAKSKGWL